jgi:catechol 2,3-dioxygenase-like lactoylglutathione lyase family enzyme
VTESPQSPPAVETVVETVVYAADLAAAEGFYASVLGLPVVGREPGRQVFFRVGPASMLLVFDPAATLRGGRSRRTGPAGQGTSPSASGRRRSPTGGGTWPLAG